jgi:flagellar biosynthesis protein FlhA
VVPNLLSLGDVVRVLRNLVREGISIRDLRTILESLAELSAQTKDAEQLTELVRERLAAHITSRVKGADGTVAALTLDPRLEEILRRSLHEIAAGTGGAVDPEMLRNLTLSAERSLKKFGAISALPLIVTSPDLRRYVRAIFERKLPQLAVVSFREVDPGAPIHILDRLMPNASPNASP